MSALRNLLTALVIGLASIAPASATEFTDLWWDPQEAGWGLNIAHQADTMFITLYVYGPNDRPTWFTVTALFTGTDTAGNLVYAGDLYESTGPWFGGAFPPNLVTLRRVGDATFRATSVDTGNITYTVDGIVSSKDIERYTLRFMNLAGEYIGGVVQTNSSCTNPALNGTSEDAAFLTVTHNGPDVQIVTIAARRTCTYRGTYGQAGRMGHIANATVTCSDGTAGTFSAFEINTSTSGLLARFFGQAAGCSYTGDMGGVFR